MSRSLCVAMALPCQGGVVWPSRPDPVWPPPPPADGTKAEEWCAAADTTAEEGFMRPVMDDTEETAEEGLFSMEVGPPNPNWPNGFTLQEKG